MTLSPGTARAPQVGGGQLAGGRYSAGHRALDDVMVREDWYRAAGWWTDELLHDFVLRHARQDPHAEAIAAAGVRLTRGDLTAQVLRVSEAFRWLGAGPGTRVVVQLPNEPEVIVVVLALARLGAAAVLAPSGLRIRELRHITQTSGAGIVVVSARAQHGANLATGRELAASCHGVHTLVITGMPAGGVSVTAGEYSLDRLSAQVSAAGPPSPSSCAGPGDVALYLLSGGTTGLPKLIPRTHQDYVCNLKVSAEIARLDGSSVYLGALPVCHNFTLGCPGVLGTLAFGGRVVLPRARTADAVLATMAAEGVTISAAVPSLAARWAASARAQPALAAELKLAVLQAGAARISAAQVGEVTAALGCTVQQVYGMSEGLLAFSRLDDAPDVVAQTQGRPACDGDEWRLVEQDGSDVPDGGPGELWVRGPYTVPGYLASADVNDAAFAPEGWYRTGDIVRWHPSGNFVVTGRRRDFINKGGEKVSATEVEELASAHPSVLSAAAIPVPSEAFGEGICVFVTLHSDGDLELAELRRFLSSCGVAPYKLPDRLEIVSELPVTAIGKVDKTALHAAAGNGKE
ncbi:MAG: AMP-binding protein [Actinomycetota bacterium]|nr:AMP-binding protein [Actinomycetota bacterium]